MRAADLAVAGGVRIAVLLRVGRLGFHSDRMYDFLYLPALTPTLIQRQDVDSAAQSTWPRIENRTPRRNQKHPRPRAEIDHPQHPP